MLAYEIGSTLSGLSNILTAATNRALHFSAGQAETTLKENRSMRPNNRAMRFALKPILGLALASLSYPSLATIPYHGTATSTSTLWWITQLGLGGAGEFEINNASNTNPALSAISNGSGPTLKVTATGIGNAIEAYGSSTATGTVSNGVWAIGYNSGSGGYFIAHNNGMGVFGQSNTGPGVRGQSVYGYGVMGYNMNSGNWGVVGGATYGVTGQGHNNAGVYAYSDTNNGIFAQSGSGNGIYATTGTGYAGYFHGDVYVNGTIHYNALSQNSDVRYKQNIRTLPNALDTVLALRGVSYDWRQDAFPKMRFDKTRQLGFIAQEVEKVVPELVSKDKQGMRSVAYTGVIPILVEAIKDQQQQIQASKAEIDTLKAQNKQLMALQTQFAALSSKLAHMQTIQQTTSHPQAAKQACLAHK